ncbi:MAG: hypothetical protein U0166_19250 [Acidobacteriota bacterium]
MGRHRAERAIARAVAESTGTAFLISERHAITERTVLGSSTSAALYFLELGRRTDAVLEEVFPAPDNLVVLTLAASLKDVVPLALAPARPGDVFQSTGFSTSGGEAIAGRLADSGAPGFFAVVADDPSVAPRQGDCGAPAVGVHGGVIGMVGRAQGQWSVLSAHRIRGLLTQAGVPHRWRDPEAEARARSLRRRRLVAAGIVATVLLCAIAGLHLWRHRLDDRIVHRHKGALTTMAVGSGTVTPADGSIVIVMAAGEGARRSPGAPLNLGPGNAGIIASLPPRLAGVKIDRVWLRTTGPRSCGGAPNGIGLFDPWLNPVHARGIPGDYGLSSGWYPLEAPSEIGFLVVRAPSVGPSPVACGFGLEELVVVPHPIREERTPEP